MASALADHWAWLERQRQGQNTTAAAKPRKRRAAPKRRAVPKQRAAPKPRKRRAAPKPRKPKIAAAIKPRKRRAAAKPRTMRKKAGRYDLRKPTTNLRLGRGRDWSGGLKILTGRIAAGKSITLYHGRTGGTRPTIYENQSWSPNPKLAMEFSLRDRSYGDAGSLWSIKVPAKEFGRIPTKRNLGHATDFDEGDSTLLHKEPKRTLRDRLAGRPDVRGSRKGRWAIAADFGVGAHDGYRLEIRPRSDRPDLTPQLIATTDVQGRARIARRLARARPEIGAGN